MPGPARGAAIALAAALASACYSYVPVAPSAAPARTTDVRVLLSAPLAVPLEGITINRARRIDGELISMNADSVFLSATTVVDAAGLEHPADAETVRIGRDRVERVEVRKAAFARTLLAAGGIIAFGTVTSAAIADGGGGGRTGGGSGQAK